MRYYFIKVKEIISFGFSRLFRLFPRLCLAMLLLCGLCAVPLADEAQNEPAISDAVREALEVALEAIAEVRDSRDAPLTVFGWLFHQDRWHTQAMYEEYGSYGIDNCVSAVPMRRKRADVLYGWNFTVADMSCNVFQARVSYDRAHSAVCDEVSVSPNLSPRRGAGLAQMELLKTVQEICDPVLAEPEETPAQESEPSGSVPQNQESGGGSPAQSDTSDSRNANSRETNTGGTNTGGTNTGGRNSGCGRQIGWNTDLTGMSGQGGSYSVTEVDHGGGCFMIRQNVAGSDGIHKGLAVEIRGREECLKSDWKQKLQQVETTATTFFELSDYFIKGC